MTTILITGAIAPPSGILAANTILDFQGGKYVGGTLTGNGTIIKAPPYQIFDGVTLKGTWKIDYVYPEYFGDTDGANAAPAINEALKFSNMTGCKVMLLAKEYKITQSIEMRGGTTLEGQIPASGLIENSKSSIYGTKIIVKETPTHAIDILTEGNSLETQKDCYRFAVRNLCIYNTTTSGNSISVRTVTGLTPRDGVIENVLIQYDRLKGGYGLYVAGASYVRFERISIAGGKGVLLDKINTFQEFIWLRQIAINGVANKSIEIKKGNNIYFTEVDVNDSEYGVYVHATASDIFTIFMQSIALVRCGTGIYFYAQSGYITRFTMRDMNVFLKNGATAIRSTRSAGYFLGDSLFDNIQIDRADGGTPNSVVEENSSMSNCRFTNLRYPNTNPPSIRSNNKWSTTFI